MWGSSGGPWFPPINRYYLGILVVGVNKCVNVCAWYPASCSGCGPGFVSRNRFQIHLRPLLLVRALSNSGSGVDREPVCEPDQHQSAHFLEFSLIMEDCAAVY